MKIKMKSGDVLDLDEYRRSLEAALETNVALVAFQRRLAVLDALQAVLAIRPIIFCSIKDDARSDGWDEAIQAVHEAAGVIEDEEDAPR